MGEPNTTARVQASRSGARGMTGVGVGSKPPVGRTGGSQEGADLVVGTLLPGRSRALPRAALSSGLSCSGTERSGMPMVDAAQNLDDPPTLYEHDFTLWCTRQAELLRLRRFDEADLPNIGRSWR